jgi:predicted esterase
VELVHLDREPAGEPEGALILLHGRGVDERDLYPLLEELDPERRLFGMTPGRRSRMSRRVAALVRSGGRPPEETFVDSLNSLCRFLDDELGTAGSLGRR